MVLGLAGSRIPDHDQRVDSICMALKAKKLGNRSAGVVLLFAEAISQEWLSG